MQKRGKLRVSRSRQCLVNKEQKPPDKKSFYPDDTLDRALKHLYRIKRHRKRKEVLTCKTKSSTESKIDDQVKLRCRQLPNVVHELRKTIMRQDWDEAATLLMILCHPGLKLYTSIIIRTCFILLFNHSNSSLELLLSFLRETTGYILEEDLFKFIKILFSLRDTALKPLTIGKYTRKLNEYKVTKDAEFERL